MYEQGPTHVGCSESGVGFAYSLLVSFMVCLDNCWQTYTKWVEDIIYYELLLLETLGEL